MTEYRSQLAEPDSGPRGLAMTSALCNQAPKDSGPVAFLLRNLELLRSCISKRGKVTDKM